MPEPWEIVPSLGAVTLSGQPIGVDDDGGSLTVDNPGLTELADAIVSAQVQLAIQKAEDSGHATGDIGTMILGVRNDANAALAGTDLDYVPLSTDSAGRLKLGDGATSLTARQNTDQLGGSAANYTPKFAVVDVAGAGDNTIVAAVANRKIRVLCGVLVAASAVTVRFESGAGGTALTGQIQLDPAGGKGGFPIPFAPIGNFETAVNTLLNLELSAAVSVDGWLVYIEAL